MTLQTPPGAKPRIAPAGLMFLAITSVGWGFNWPATKYLIGELPPLTLRGTTGVIGASLLAILALARGQSLKVRRDLWRLGQWEQARLREQRRGAGSVPAP